MAKEDPNTKSKTTPFRNFEQLAKKIVRIPTSKVQERKGQLRQTS